MENAVERYKNFLSSLTDHIFELELKLGCLNQLDHIARSRPDDSKLVPILYNPIFYSLQADSIVSICKLYENKNNVASLPKFLNFSEQNAKSICASNNDITLFEFRRMVRDHKSEIENRKGDLELIFGARHKYFAHLDKKYGLDSSLVASDFPISLSKIEELLHLAVIIINKHSWALSKSARIGLGDLGAVHIEQIFERAYEANRKAVDL